MSRRQQPAPTPVSEQQFIVTVDELRDQIRRLWQAVDTIRAELQAVLDLPSDRQELPPPFRLTSMPLDPCDPAWNQKLNALKPKDLPPELQPAPLVSARDTEEVTIAQEGAEQIFYCCSEPQLAWAGDPDEPSVLCRKCGYIVAEYGTVIDEHEAWREGTASFEPSPPRAAQGELFGEDE